jgi:hypothetical protein
MKNWMYFLFAWILYMTFHESIHAIIALIYGEYNSMVIHWYGPQVIFVTPVAERMPDMKWLAISGSGNFATLLLGYILYGLKKRIYQVRSSHLRGTLYYVTIVFLLFDAVNLSVGPFFYGGDTMGISAGLRIESWIIQLFFGFILVTNRELIVTFMKSFGVSSGNILFRPWFRKKIS